MTRWTDSKRNTHFIKYSENKPITPSHQERTGLRGSLKYFSLIFYHIFPLLFIDNPIFFHSPKNCPTFLQDQKGRDPLSLFFRNLGDGLDGSFDVHIGVESAQAKSDRSPWESPNGVVGCRRTVKSWTTEDAKLFF
jgi:hypothetical protein